MSRDLGGGDGEQKRLPGPLACPMCVPGYLLCADCADFTLFFKLGIFLIYIFNAIPKVPHTHPQQFLFLPCVSVLLQSSFICLGVIFLSLNLGTFLLGKFLYVVCES